MAAITSAAWSAKRTIDGRLGAVFAQHNSTDRNSTSRCAVILDGTAVVRML